MCDMQPSPDQPAPFLPPWAHFETLVSQLRDGVTVQDESGKLVYANEAGALMSGYANAAELLAAPVGDYARMFDVASEGGSPVHLAELPGRRALAEGASSQILRVRNRATDVVRYSDVRSFAVNDAGARYVVNIVRDVTDAMLQQRLLEDQAQELEEQTAQAQGLTEELEQSNTELVQALRAEQEALQRESYLSRASDILGSSLDYETTIQQVASMVVPELADWSGVVLVGDHPGAVRQIAVAHVDPAKVRWARELHEKFPPNMDAPAGMPNVLRTGKPELYPSITDDVLVQSARTAEELVVLRELNLRSVMVVPLNAGDRVLGVMTLVTAESDKIYTESDLAFATELGRRAGMAIERAALHKRALDATAAAEEHARWLAQLQWLTIAVSRSLTTADVLDLAVTLGRESFEADRATIWLFSSDRKSLTLAGHYGLPDDIAREVNTIALSANVPVAVAVRSGEPLFIEDQQSILDTYSEASPAIIATDTIAVAAMPIKVGGETIGGLTFSYTRPQHFSADYISASRTFSKELGQAIERTRAIANLEEARNAAMAASRAKSAFVATMSHELRTPLNAIMGFSQLLQLNVDDGDRERASAYLARIRSNTEHLMELINDILDWSKVEAGQMSVSALDEHARDVVADALSVVSEQAAAHGVALSSRCADGASYVGDPLRVKQILLNLLSNGIKFTPAGGRVSIDCTCDAGITSFAVADTGSGIKPDEIEPIFEPFVQADHGYTRAHGGTGLGLSISRRLARLMGGDVVIAETVPGKGSRFLLTLPSRR